MDTRRIRQTIIGFFGFVLACGGGGTSGPGPGPDVGTTDVHYDALEPDLGPADTLAEAEPACAQKKLDFVQAVGDTDQPCKGKNVCDIVLSYNQDRDLQVQLTACGAPVPGAAISWEILNDTFQVGGLGAQITYTGQDGTTTNLVKNVKAAIGQFQVKVCVSGDAETPCIYFNVAINPKGIAPLSVGFADYKGMYPLIDTAKVYLFKQGGTGKPKCADLNLANLPTATVVSPDVYITQTAVFAELPNLETEKIQYYTILGLARSGQGPVQAYACNDTDGKVEWGGKKYVELTLIDIPPSLKGSYDITNTFDLVSGLPPNVANVVYTIVGFFENPAAQIMLLICQAGEDTLEDFCEYLFQDPQNPDINKLTTTGDVVFQILNVFLLSLIEQYCPFEDPSLCGKIYWTGKDVGDILTKFQLLSTFTFLQEPDSNGHLPAAACQEKWHTVRVRWTLGLDCPPADENCGWKNLPLGGPGLPDIITGNFEADLVQASKLSIAPHTLNFKYGALVNFAIEKLLLPQVFGDGSDGLPAVDSYEALIGSLLAGKECLITDDCCSKFAENVTNQTFGLTKNFVEGACQALVDTGANYLRQQLLSLDAQSDNFTIGTKSPCPVFDTDKNMRFDAFGKKTEQCEWDAKLVVGGTAYAPVGTFWGKAK